MRIIGGEFKRRKIGYPEAGGARPTKDRIREAVFNMIAAEVPGRTVLDLFSGSGAYGLEALSRGAASAVFVEKERGSVSVINDNIGLLNVADRTSVVIGDVFEKMKIFFETGKKFDIIFSDPPFNRDMAKKTLITLNRYDILCPSGLLILEHAAEEEVPAAPGDFSICRQKTYKKILISVYLKK